MEDEQKSPAQLPNPLAALIAQGETPEEAVKILEEQQTATRGGEPAKEAVHVEAPKPEAPKAEEPIAAPKYAHDAHGKLVPLGPVYPKRFWDTAGIHAVRTVNSPAEERSLGAGWSDKPPVPAKPGTPSPMIHAKRLIPGFEHPHKPDADSIHATAVIPKA
jgi:hypothetical protein